MNNKELKQIHFIILISTIFLGGFVLGSGDFHPIIFILFYWLFIILACLSGIFIILIEKQLEKEINKNGSN